MRNSGADEEFISGINIAPLVDVVLVLLIIFMATAPLIHKRAIKVNVPKAAHTERKATATVRIAFDENKKLFLENDPVTREELKFHLVSLVKADPLVHVALLADQTIPYGDVVEVLDIVRGAKVKKLALEVRSKKVEGGR